MSCSIASVTSYLIENEAENLQSGISREPFGALRSVMARFFFFIFHALSFELNFFLTGGSL